MKRKIAKLLFNWAARLDKIRARTLRIDDKEITVGLKGALPCDEKWHSVTATISFNIYTSDRSKDYSEIRLWIDNKPIENEK